MAHPTRHSLHSRSHSRSRVHARSYDARGRLSNVTLGSDDLSPTTRYAHNLLGQRVFKTNPVLPPAPGDESDPVFMQSLLAYFAQVWNPTASNPQAAQDSLGTAYLYSTDEHLGASTLLGEYSNAAGSPRAEHAYLPTPAGPLPVYTVLNGARYAVIADHLHTPRTLMQTNLITNWQWPYSAFGEEPPTQRKYRFVNPATVNLGETTTAAPLNYNLRFPGQLADAESGLFYNYFRSYDSRTGRYSQSDPIGLSGGWNRFGYVEQNPLSFTDPLGLDATVWRFPNGPTNGNWGGRCWSGGQQSCGDAGPGTRPPTDSADACYQRHDTCYARCGNDTKCIFACDRSMVNELRLLPNDPRNWPLPPRPGTERDSRTYRDRAMGWYSK
jgi:RHS repeat-associated protein